MIKYHEVFKLTDEFVNILDSEEYKNLCFIDAIQFSHDNVKFTEGGDFQVFPFARLIDIRIQHEASDEEYELLRKALALHYANDKRVNSVYRCQAGTIVIDCRYQTNDEQLFEDRMIDETINDKSVVEPVEPVDTLNLNDGDF